MKKQHIIKLLLLGIVISAHSLSSLFAGELFKSDSHPFRVEKLVGGLQQPWGFDFLPDQQIIVTEKKGTVKLFNPSTGQLTKVKGEPNSVVHGQGGLLDVLVHPDFSDNSLIYFTFTEPRQSKYGTSVYRAKLSGRSLIDGKVIFRGKPESLARHHFGSRIRMGGDGMLYISHGDRGDSARAQKNGDHAGKIIRLSPTGEIPADNPFREDTNYAPEIYSLGHRNPQGMAVHPLTGQIWINEHGAMGGDEINVIQAGKNYGWPVISYGLNYNGSKIGIGSQKKGMEQPFYYWDPSIAPSGMTFYSGKKFSQWANNLFVGSLKFGLIVRLEIKGNKVIKEERLLNNAFGRIRDVKESPDGGIMFINDDSSGGLFLITPAN